LLDAEQTYFQPAIDYIALRMSDRYNKKAPIVHNTYQMYLKDGMARMQKDLERAKKQNLFFWREDRSRSLH